VQCPPCKVFTPVLIGVYKTLTSAGRNFEVVYVGSDRSAEYFTEYFSSMPWLAVPFGDARIDKLTKHFNVKSMCTLLINTPSIRVLHDRGIVEKLQLVSWPSVTRGSQIRVVWRCVDGIAQWLGRWFFTGGFPRSVPDLWLTGDQANSAFHLFGVAEWVVIHYRGGDHLNGRLGLRVAVWQHRSKSLCTGLACCGQGRIAAFSLMIVPLKVVCANVALYRHKWVCSTFHFVLYI